MQFITISGDILYVALPDIVAVKHDSKRKVMILLLAHGHVVPVENTRLSEVLTAIFKRTQ